MIKWRKFMGYTKDGTESMLLNPIIPYQSGELFLRQVLTMPRENKQTIKYDQAQDLFMNAYHEFCLRPGVSFEEVQVMYNSLVGWVSSQGYYIELDHTEYTGGEDRRH